jgi:gliding motility-associated-like protein
MKGHSFLYYLTLLQLLALPFLQGQTTAMQVTPVDNIDQLVRDVFIKEGECSRVSNIQLIGREAGVGAFSVDAGAISIGLSGGLILSTGDAIDVVGPNETNNTTSSGDLNSSDYDLRRLSGRDVFDATGIEFDFVPSSSVVSFNYVFASEEYCEFVNQEFNDVFGFFVSGPGLNGKFDRNAINVALLPDTDERVAINSVNHLRNAQFFIPNFLDRDIEECKLPPRFEPLRDVEFDGFTTRLRATIEVIPCQTYHIRLVVGDVSDNILDSGVFLEANSFDLGENIGVSAEVVGSESNVLYENCLEGNFVFERRTLANRARPLKINYRIEGLAENGTDYEEIPGEITIPVGQRFARLPIKAIADNLPEGAENIRIITEIPTCDCVERDTAQLFLEDQKAAITVSFEEEWACPDQTFQLAPVLVDGLPPYRYTWNTGDTTSFIETAIAAPTNYELTVTDACGAVGMDSVEVALQPPPVAYLGGTTDWCEGGVRSTLPVSMEGNPPWSITYRDGQDSIRSLSNITQNPFPLPVTGPGAYTLVQFEDKNCRGTGFGQGQVNTRSFSASYTTILPSCRTASDGEIQLRLRGGQAPYTVTWNRPTTDSFLLSGVGVGRYTAEIRDANGCLQVLEAPIAATEVRADCFLPRKSIYIPNAFSPNGDQVNDLFQVYPRAGSFESIYFEVYDRWGSLLYRSEPFLGVRSGIGWDGATAPIGVYLCKVVITLTDGRVEDLAQSFQLMR